MAIETSTTDCPNIPDPRHYNLPKGMVDYMSQYNSVIIGLFGTYKDDVDTTIAGVNTNIETFAEYIRHDGTTDLTGDWNISSNSLLLDTGNITLTTGKLTAFTVDVTDQTIGYQMAGETILTNKGIQNLRVGEGAGGLLTGRDGTFVGYFAGGDTVGGGNNTYVGNFSGRWGKGGNNVAVGDQSAQGSSGNSTYDHLTAVGNVAAFSLTTGDFITAIGSWAAKGLTEGSYGVFVGKNSGEHFTTEDGILMIDAYPRTNPGGLAKSKAGAIIYGQMATTPAAQILDINVAALNIGSDAAADVALMFKTSGDAGAFTWKVTEDYFLYADDIALADTEFLIFDKAAGNGIKVDTATPTYGFADLLGEVFAKNTGASKPTRAAWKDGTNGFQFAVGKEEEFEFHIPHDYVKGTDTFLHIHWGHNATNVTGGTMTFDYEMTYSKGHGQGAFGANAVGTIVSAVALANQYSHELSEGQTSISGASGTQIDTDDLEPDGVIKCTVGINANNLTVDSGSAPDIFMHYIDIHYQTTSIIGTKDKAPDFYA